MEPPRGDGSESTAPEPSLIRRLARAPELSVELVPGTRLGPYEIVTRVAGGGMGEVYRARDPRLGRDVALKVMRFASGARPDLVRRFEHEARAAGALNHPNVLAVYDSDEAEGVPYIVFELLEGETLATRLERGALGAREATRLARQIAIGLAAAHARGIVHRDLKPDNLFLTRDGVLKILDFGLAKLRPDDGAAGAASLSGDGAVMGTIGYMAPEQARGQAADARSDVFAFGAILFEMLAGRPAFPGATGAERAAAVLKDEPAGAEAPPPDVQPALWRLCLRCLEKRPEDRIESARQIAFFLEAFTGDGPGQPASMARARSYRRPIMRAVVGAAVLAAAGGAYLLGRGRAAPRAEGLPVIQRLTFRLGQVSSARFANDSATVVFAAIWDGQPSDLFTTRLGSAESRSLGLPAADLLSVSPSGDLAVLLDGRLRDRTDVRPTGTIARVPLAGGAPRGLVAGAQEADWSRNDLAVVREVGGRSRLELPAGTVLHESITGWISHPRASPSGELVAFLEHANRGDDLGSVVVVDRRGRARTLATGFVSVQGLAWSPREDLVLFTGARSGVFRALYAVDLAGAERLLYRAPAALTLQDVAADGKILVTHSSPRFGVMVRTDPQTPERDLAWLDGSDVADLSADGQTLLFVEVRAGGGPTASTFVRRTDGGPAVLLGQGDAWSLSSDGAWALTVPIGRAPRPLLLLPTGAGETRTLAAEGLDHFAAIFFPSAQRILCAASPEGSAPRLYVRDLTGGPPRAVTPPGIIHEPAVTPDGSAVAVVGADQRPWLFPVEAGEPRAIEGTEPGDLPARFSSDGKYLFLFRRGDWPAPVFRLELATGRRERWLEIMPAEPAGSRGIIGRFRITPDGRSYAYTYDRSLSDLFLLSGIEQTP